jgi:hypothetical protein
MEKIRRSGEQDEFEARLCAKMRWKAGFTKRTEMRRLERQASHFNGEAESGLILLVAKQKYKPQNRQ